MASSPIRALAAVIASALVLAGCVNEGDQQDAAPKVVVTTSILGDVVTNVLDGIDVEVEVLMGPGVDPHAYAPSAKDALRIREADLVIANGLGLEVALDDALDAAVADGVRVVRVGEAADPLPFAANEADEEHEDETDEEHAAHAQDGLDPHVWLDPDRVALMALEIGEAYGPEAEQGARSYATAMTELAEELAAQVDTLPVERRVLVTNHDALGYLADRFGFTVLATVLPGSSTQAEPSAGDFAELARTVAAADVPVIFTDAESSDRIATSLADQVGDVEVVALYAGSLGPPGSGAETLAGMLRQTVERIVNALTQG